MVISWANLHIKQQKEKSMNKIVRSIIDVTTSAAALFVLPLVMIVVTWGMADNWISWFWVLVLAAVLTGEILNYIFTGKTVSNNIRDEVKRKTKTWRIWVMLICWLVFSVQLFLHFIKPILN